MPEDTSLVLLLDSTDPFELDMLTPLLKQEGIPFVERQTSSGGYLKLYFGNAGTSVFGTQIYVSSDDYARAKELAEAYLDSSHYAQDVIEISEDDTNILPSEYESEEAALKHIGMDFGKRKKISRIILIAFIVLFIVLPTLFLFVGNAVINLFQ